MRGVMMKITLAHKLHKMTPELDNACSYVLKDVDIEDAEKSYSLKALPMEQQGLFVIGYNSPDYKTLGVSAVKIKAARESAGLTIRALAEKNRAVHCNHSTCRVRKGSLESVYPRKDRSRLRRYHC